MKSKWKLYLLYASLIIIGGGLIYLLLETVRAKNTGFETKTLWDWMELLIIPIFLTGGVLFLNRSERNAERDLANDRQHEAALQAYIDRMSELLLKENLRTTKKAEVRDIARTLTLNVLRGMDGARKGYVINFLLEAKLINGKKRIVDLTGADLRGAEWGGGTVLDEANLGYTDLRDTKFEGVYFMGSIISPSNLTNTRMKSAKLTGIDLSNQTLQGADLRGADLTNADLRGADLRNADLRGYRLIGRRLKVYNISGTRLDNANLENANLEGAKVTKEQLGKTKSLVGAIMPDGTKHI